MKYIIFFFLIPCFAIAQSPEQLAAEILRERAAIQTEYARLDSLKAELKQIEIAQQFRADLQALLFEPSPKWYIQPVAAILPKKVFIIKNKNNQ
jgi:hypothetical protein